MDIQLDIKNTMNKAIGVCTKFGEFWKGMEFPGSIGPAVSYLLIIGLLPAVGFFFSSLMWFLGFLISGVSGGYIMTYFFGSVLIYPVLFFAFWVAMPVVMGILLAAVDPAMNINKGDANSYTTVLAYSITPAAVASLAASVVTGLGGFLTLATGAFGIFWLFNLIAIVVGLAGGIIALIQLYNGYTQGLETDSGQAIILMVIQFFAYLIVGAIVFGIFFAIFRTGYMGFGGFGGFGGFWR